MNRYDVKTIDGVDFFYVGNDVNGNCKYAVNYRFFLHDADMDDSFEERYSLAKMRAKKCGFERELTSHIEPFFTIRPTEGLAKVARIIKNMRDALC